MGWSNITGDESIIPSTTGGNLNEIKFETDKAAKIRLMLRDGEEPYSYLEHCIEVETIQNGQVVRQFRTIRCPKTSKNPNAPCKLCDGQQARRRVRHACNCFDYETGKIQKLNAGEQVFKTIATTRKMGVNILGVDWGIMKTGVDRNDTTYTVTNLGPSQFEYNPETMGAMFDIEQEYAPITSEDDMKSIVEGIGGDWNALTTPPKLVYPTLQEALEHKMPNGRYKDQTLRQIWESDRSPRGFIAYLALKSDRQNDEKAAAQVIYSALGGVYIEGVPTNSGTKNVQEPVQQDAPAPMQTHDTASHAPVDGATSSVRADKIAQINKAFTTQKKFIDGGFDAIINTMKQYSGGKTNIQDFTDNELDALLAGCTN